MLGKIVLPVEFCNRNILKSERLARITTNMAQHGYTEIVEKLRGHRNPLYGLLRQCQLVGGTYQKIFSSNEVVFHPVHPFLYSKREQLIILRLFEGDITEYLISTMVNVPDHKAQRRKTVGDKQLYWGVASKLSELDELLFGQTPQEILLPGDVANVFGLEVLSSLKTPFL